MAKKINILTASMKKKIQGLDKLELETNYLGHVSKQKDFIQIKVWFKKDSQTDDILVGLITFDKNILDFDFKGLIKESNSKFLLDYWFYTGCCEYYIEKSFDNEWYLKFSLKKQFGHPEVALRMKKLSELFPEYNDRRIKL
jgi:hypothetical protein